MTSLETLIITVFALIAIFAITPAVMWQIYFYQAEVEARTVTAFFVSLADAVESDLGSAYAQKALSLPTLRFGSLTYKTEVVAVCGGAPVYNTTFVYTSPVASTYGIFRGIKWAPFVEAPDSPLAVAGFGTEVVLTPRAVKYGDIILLLNITYSAYGGGSAVVYKVYMPKFYDSCTIGQRVVVVPVEVELR